MFIILIIIIKPYYIIFRGRTVLRMHAADGAKAPGSDVI